MIINKHKRFKIYFIAVVVGLTVVGGLPSLTNAANFTAASMRLNRMKVSIANNQVLVVAKPITAGTEGKVVVTFSSGFGVDSTPANITTSVSGLPSTYGGLALSAWPTISAAASAVDSKTVTFTCGDLSVGTAYGFFITAGITNPSGAGNNLVQTIATKTAADAAIDSSQVAVAIITDDEVVITATVPPIFSFALGANSDSFTANLSSSGVVSTNGVTVTIGTNGTNGWIAWLKSANAALNSATTSQAIATQGTVDDACTTLVNNNDYYQLDTNITTDSAVGSGTVAIADEYDCGASAGGTFSTAFQEIATGSGTTDGDVITLVARATISAIKAAAADYTDTWTVIGAANF
jgi:hypothetical protein